MKKIAIIGSGSWGVALAIHLASIGNKVKIWSYEEEEKRLIKKLYNSMELKPTKTKLAENIGISRIKLSKILNDYKEIKKKN